MNKYIHWFSVDAIPIPVKKKKSFQKYQDSRGRGLTVIQLYWTTRNFLAQRRAVFGTMFFTVRNSIATMLQRCVALKVVVANRSV